MPSDAAQNYAISTREGALSLLEDILHGRIDPERIRLDFSQATWVNFHLKLEGFHYKSALDSGIMSALIGYQNALYRVAAYISNEKLNGNALPDEIKSKLELTFRIKDGSSEVDATWYGALAAFASEVTKGMSPRMKFTLTGCGNSPRNRGVSAS